MTNEMIISANRLIDAANEYRKLFEKEIKKEPVIYVEVTDCSRVDFGTGVFIADSFNCQSLKKFILK